MARKKPYDDGCATAHALEIIGERWALLIVRELVPGPLRFSDLKAALPGVSSNTLTTRLSELEAAQVLCRRSLPPPASVTVYALTGWGAELKPLIMQLGRWAARSPGLVPGKPMSAASVLMSFETMFAPDRARGIEMTLQLNLGGRPHVARIENARLTVTAGDADDADLHLTADDPTALAQAVYGGVAPSEVPGLAVVGDRALLAHFCSFFPLPGPWRADDP
ncbi:winged helix-turn-helix transcriptional regulator [Puniceibacterium confluentis]|uniref:winged helix-turn-helix transcriptional regulator n=1 Tax=Puniceibacterium confluentis TaxID=1958944 RepID=UPI0011B4BA9A|nr:helix-turn-helix domain-containing protein [Puniceibacterium confluentis]